MNYCYFSVKKEIDEDLMLQAKVIHIKLHQLPSQT